jgi:hypothetical protein
MANDPLSPGLLNYDVQPGAQIRILAEGRDAGSDAEIIAALALAGLVPVVLYAGELPTDWPTDERALPGAGRAVRAQGTATRALLPTAVNSGTGSVVIFQAWRYSPAPVEVLADGVVRSETIEAPPPMPTTGCGAPCKPNDLDDAAFPAIVELAKALGVPPHWVLLVFYLESRLNPHVGNSAGYVGLNQLKGSYLRSQFGVEPAAYLLWSASEQIKKVISPWYLDTYAMFSPAVPTTAGGLYALNIGPARVKSGGYSPGTVIYKSPEKNYTSNKGLDFNKDGTITIGDFDAFLTRLAEEAPYKAAAAKLATYVQTKPAAATTSTSTSNAGKIVLGIALAGLAGAGAWWGYKRYQKQLRA